MDRIDPADPTDASEPTERAEPNDSAEPTDAADNAEPSERHESTDQAERDDLTTITFSNPARLRSSLRSSLPSFQTGPPPTTHRSTPAPPVHPRPAKDGGAVGGAADRALGPRPNPKNYR
jgi:hypothetical protein